MLARTGTITGRVVVAGTSAPPARFSAHAASPRVEGSYSAPGVDGAFAIRDVRPGTLTLEIASPGFVPSKVRDVVVEANETTDVSTITVQRGRTITGKVVDGAGQPVADARVGFGNIVRFDDAEVDLDERRSGSITVSDATGAFVLVGVTEHARLGPMPLVVAAEHPVRGRSLAVDIPAGVADPPPVTLVLRATGSIAGHVTQAGKPVTAMIGAGWPELGAAMTNDDGAFAISKLPAGPLVLRTTVYSPRAPLLRHPWQTTVTVVAGTQVDVTIDVPVGNLALLLDVKPRAGDDVPAAKLYLFTGTVAIERYSQIAAQYFIGSRGTGEWRGPSSPPVRFGDLVAGVYTLCALPRSATPRGPDYLRDHGDQIRVYCTPTTIAAAPAEQSITIEVPSEPPLPP